MKKILIHDVSVLLFLLMISIMSASAVYAADTCTYYVSSSEGNDAADGMSDTTPWASITKVNQGSGTPGDTICFKRGDVWRHTQHGWLALKSGAPGQYVTYSAYGGGPKPVFLGSDAKNNTVDWTLTVSTNVWTTSSWAFNFDVANVIFNNGESTGYREWDPAQLDQQGEYYYDPNVMELFVYSSVNPASYYSGIECALTRNMLSVSNEPYVKVSNLDLRYGGIHGIHGTRTNNIIISDNDISFIGGAVARWDTDPPVRAGNAIEFWANNDDILVTRNRIWEIYDAALTSQGGDTNVMSNHRYTFNVIRNVGYCFEYWQRQATAVTQNIYFENNTCINSGYGWGGKQRPWQGQDLMLSVNPSITTGFYVRNNIFYEADPSAMVLNAPWNLSELALDYNLWYQPSGIMIHYLCTYDEFYNFICFGEYTMNQFADYQAETGKGVHSLAADPLFIDIHNENFKPAQNSPACTLSDTGIYVGAVSCEIDSDNDGMSDDFENLYGLNPNDPSDADSDNDSDGLSNIKEFQQGTDPTDPDTDGDGILDISDTCPLSQPVSVSGTEYSSLQIAYINSDNNATSYIQTAVLSEDVTFSLNKSIILDGGYDCSYSGHVGTAIINGNVTVSDGVVKILSGSIKLE